MSKSMRAPKGEMSPPAKDKKHLFIDGTGTNRTGWLLTASLLSYALLALAVRFGLVRAFAALFRAWGVDLTTAGIAPWWARWLFIWHGSLVSVVYYLLTLALCRWLWKLWGMDEGGRRPDMRGLIRSALTGAGLALAVLALCLAPDSVRLQWPLSAPRLSWRLIPLCAVSLLGALAEECFTKRVLMDGVTARWGLPWGCAVACVVFFLINVSYTGSWTAAVNVLLLGLACCLLYREKGIWTAAGFRWGWSVVNVFLSGFGGGDVAVYRLYGVSEDLLTGGDAGPANGLWTALMLAIVVGALLIRGKRVKTPGKATDEN